MAIELFWGSGSPYAWRVLLTLEVKGIAYESRIMSFSSDDLKSDWFRALSPRGKVPCMRDGATVLSESLAIMVYLDRLVPEPALFGRDAAEAGRIFRVISEYTSYVDPAVEAFILPLYFGKAAGKAPEVRAAAATLERELARLEATLGVTIYLAGDALSAADLLWYPHLKSIERAASKEAAKEFAFDFIPLRKTYPSIHAWASRIEGLPGYDRTFPPHWRT